MHSPRNSGKFPKAPVARNPRTPRRLLWTVLALLLAVCYLWLQVLPLLDDRGTGVAGLASPQNDYKHLYLGSRLLAEGRSPYDGDLMLRTAGYYAGTEDGRFGTILPYVYPPFTGWVLRPLTALPFANSVVAFQLLNHLLVLGGLLLAARLALTRDWIVAACVALALGAFSHPLLRQNNAGQLNAALLGGFALLFLAERRRWPAPAAGGIAAFLMLFKLSPGIFLLWYLLRREWRKAAWMAGFALLFTLMTILLYGYRTHLDFIPVVQDMGYGKSTWAERGHTFWRDRANVSPNATFHRFFVDREGSGISPWADLGPRAANAMTWAVSLLLLGGFAAATALRRNHRALDASFALAVLTSLLLPSILWDHYLVQFLLPVILLAGVAVGLGARLVPLALIGVSVVLAAVPLPLGAPELSGGAGLLVQSAKLLPVLTCYGLALWLLARENPDT